MIDTINSYMIQFYRSIVLSFYRSIVLSFYRSIVLSFYRFFNQLQWFGLAMKNYCFLEAQNFSKNQNCFLNRQKFLFSDSLKKVCLILRQFFSSSILCINNLLDIFLRFFSYIFFRVFSYFALLVSFPIGSSIFLFSLFFISFHSVALDGVVFNGKLVVTGNVYVCDETSGNCYRACNAGDTQPGCVNSCSASTISNCVLSNTNHNGTSGTCRSGYTGSCSYRCNNGTWQHQSNSCSISYSSCSSSTYSNCILSSKSHGSCSGSCRSGYTGSCSYCCNNGSWQNQYNNCTYYYNPPPPPPPPPPPCFLKDTLVTMADGTLKPVQEVQVGDKLLGKSGINTVLQLKIRDYKGDVYSINGSTHFVTGGHPFMTKEGWKAFNLITAEKLNPDLDFAGALQVGNILIRENNEEEMLITYSSQVEKTRVYNFEVDEDNTYYANGYLVHNKLPPPPPPPCTESTSWSCTTYSGYHCCTGYQCGVSVGSYCQPYGEGCFKSGTLVTMANGKLKPIEQLQAGDKVLGTGGTNTVLQLKIRDYKGEVYSINGSNHFVTAGHPFKTKEGWKAFDLEIAKAISPYIDFVGALQVGDILLRENDEEEMLITYSSKAETTRVYNLTVDGDNTYYASSYLVHNKGCFKSGTLVTLDNGKLKPIQELQAGDKVIGKDGINTILKLRITQHKGLVYSINDSTNFVTGGHPFMTKDGWKAFDLEIAKELNPDLDFVGTLKEGDILIKANGKEEKLVKYNSQMEETTVYNLQVDGDSTYYANGYLVHNK